MTEKQPVENEPILKEADLADVLLSTAESQPIEPILEKAGKVDVAPVIGQTKNSPAYCVLATLIIVCLGLGEGLLIAWSGVASPACFRGQFAFETWGIMKLFLSALGTSMIAQALWSLKDPERFERSRFYSNISVPYSRAVIGCFVLGVGMFFCGSGPTMFAITIGVGGPGYTVVGGVIAAVLFGLLEPIVGLSDIADSSVKHTSVDGKLGRSYATIALPFGVFLLVAAIVIEFLSPNTKELASLGILLPGAISPVFGGLSIGLFQIPLRMITEDGQGGSTSFMTVVSTLTCGLVSKRHRVQKLEHTYQILYVYAGTMLGAWLITFDRAGFETPASYGWAQSMIGGFACILGARVAAGCTCGHGISGASELSLSSFAAAASMFAGGIITNFIYAAIV